MKKWLAVIILILSSCVCFACGKTPTISYAKAELQVNFDETYTIDKDDIVINHSKNSCVVTILNTEIAELDGLTIKPKKEGRTFVRFAIENEDVYVDIPLTITHIIFATNAEIECQNVIINITLENETFNRITLNENCNEKPQISYDRNIISYDYITGKIIPVKVGTTTVVVLYNACNVSFTVTVIDVVYTTAIEIDDHILYVGNSGTFDYKVYPQLANTYSFFCLPNEILAINSKGEYLAKGTGEVVVYINYYTSENTPATKTFNVNVINELEAFNFVIKKSSGAEAKYYLKELEYKIVIEDISNVKEEDIVVSNNFDVDSVVINENNIEILGYFVNVGEQEIELEITSNNNVVSSSNVYEVFDASDIQIVAKWSAYNQQPYNDGKYHIKLEETANYPSYLRFSLSVNEINISETFKVYDVTLGKTETTANFYPTSAGEYVFLFEIFEVEVGQIVVVVE